MRAEPAVFSLPAFLSPSPLILPALRKNKQPNRQADSKKDRTNNMPPKKSAAAAAKAAAIAAGKRKVGEAAAPERRSSGRHAGGGAPPAPPPAASGKNSRKQKAPQRSRASEDDASDAVAVLAAPATRGGNASGGGGGGGAGPSSARPSAAAAAAGASRGRKPGRAIPGAPPPPVGPLNVPKVSLKVELSTLGGAFLGRKALSVVVPADAALWDVRRSIDATCRLLNNGLVPPQAARMTMRTIDLGGGGGGGGGGEGGASAAAPAPASEGPPLALEPVHNGKETYLASYSIVPCAGGAYTLEMRPTRLSRQEEAKRAKKRSRRSLEGGADAGDGDFDALAGSGPRGRGRPRSAHLNPSGRPRSAAAAARASAPPPIADDGTRVHLDNGARRRIKWSNDETSILVAGVQRLGDGQWATIRKAHLALFESTGRTDVDLKDKWRNLKRAMRRDSTVPGLAPEHMATLRAAVAEEDEKAAAGGQ